MNEISPTSVCIDDERFFILIESTLSGNGTLFSILRYCRQNEQNFRKCLNWLMSREDHCPLAKDTLDLAVLELSNRLSFIHAFHGCRVTPDSHYEIEGIMPLTRDWIETEIIRWAGELPKAGSEANDWLQNYLRDYSGKVCAVKSLALHQERGGYCHPSGSETLRTILQKQFPDALARYLQAGEPSIIEFRIPLSQLAPRVWENYVSDLLRIYLKNCCLYPGLGDPREGGIILNQGVAPSWLIQRYSCDEKGQLTGKNYPY